MNLVVLKGNLGSDPEIRRTDTTTVANFSLATKGYKDNTDWHKCVAFGKTADLIEQYIKKGDSLLIEGSIQYSQHEDKWYTKIIINRIHFLGSKTSGSPTTQNESEGKTIESDDLPF